MILLRFKRYAIKFLQSNDSFLTNQSTLKPINKIICTNLSTNTHDSNKKLRVVFFGTDLFSIHILNSLQKLLADKVIDEVNVVTSASVKAVENKEKKDLDYFRGNQIIDLCTKNKIKYHLWSNIKQDKTYKELTGFHIGVVASFGHLIPSNLINLFPYGIINVHPSLLPRWRGASPIVYSVIFNDKIVGVSIMKILPKHFDIGPIISKKSLEMPANTTSLKLLDILGNLGNEMIIELFKNFETTMKGITSQTNENVTYAHKISSDMFFVDWQNQTSLEIDCQYRGLNEINSLKTRLNGQIAKLMNMVEFNSIDYKKYITNENELEPGTIRYIKNENLIAIKAKDGFVGFKTILLRKKLTAKDFYNGYLNNRGVVKFESISNTIKKNLQIAKIK